MKKLVIAGMLAAFAATVILPVVMGSDNAIAASKKSSHKATKKKPTGKM